MKSKRLFDEELLLQVPQGTILALERAALQARMRPGKLAEYLLLEALDANGFSVKTHSGRFLF